MLDKISVFFYEIRLFDIVFVNSRLDGIYFIYEK